MDKLKFMTWAFAGTAILCAIAFVLVGIFAPIEPGMTLFGHIMKCFVGWAAVTVILETMMYTLGQIAFHWADDYKDKYGKGWFWKGLKADWEYIKEKITMRKVLKVILIYVAFFASCLVLFWLADLLWGLMGAH